MTGPVQRPSEGVAIGEAFNRIRILEAVVQTAGPPSPYRTFTVLSDGTIMDQVILAEPGRVFGWNYHNENEFSVYANLSNSAVSPGAVDISLGMPPEGGSGHMFNSGGIVFDEGIAFLLTTDINQIIGPTAPPADSCTCDIFYMLESDIL